MKIAFNEHDEHLIDVFTGKSLTAQISAAEVESFIEENQLNYEKCSTDVYNWYGGYIESEESCLVKSGSPADYLENNLDSVVKMYLKHQLN